MVLRDLPETYDPLGASSCRRRQPRVTISCKMNGGVLGFYDHVILLFCMLMSTSWRELNRAPVFIGRPPGRTCFLFLLVSFSRLAY